MITRPTVLILGAGASIPYGFPSGQKLLEDICSLTMNPPRYTWLTNAGFSPVDLNKFRHALQHSGKISVDAFLEERTDFLEIGKAAIASCLIPYEKPASLFYFPVPSEPYEAWYQYLFEKMASKLEDFGNNKISFITYNYDRSLEYYFTVVLKHLFNATNDQIQEQVSKIPIVHLHGKLGNLWYEGGASREYNALCKAPEFTIASAV